MGRIWMDDDDPAAGGATNLAPGTPLSGRSSDSMTPGRTTPPPAAPPPARRRSTLLRPRLLVAPLLASLAGTAACGNDPETPSLGEGELRVLFVGNSLTYVNDLPGMVGALAVADGVDFAYAVQAIPNYALGDHWNAGVDGIIWDLKPDVVILQQGPSSLPSSRSYLMEWAGRIGQVVTGTGGRSALFMVWPERARMNVFDAVRDNYADAADLVRGIFIPAGETWRAAWARDPDLALYGTDGYHPSVDGSAAAALTIWAMLAGESEEPPPCATEVLPVEAATADVLCDAMRESVAAWGVW